MKHFRKTQTTELARRVSASAGRWRAQKEHHLGVSNILPVAKFEKKTEKGPFGDFENFSRKKNEKGKL